MVNDPQEQGPLSDKTLLQLKRRLNVDTARMSQLENERAALDHEIDAIVSELSKRGIAIFPMYGFINRLLTNY